MAARAWGAGGSGPGIPGTETALALSMEAGSGPSMTQDRSVLPEHEMPGIGPAKGHADVGS
jgi:hypothetical protein